ncbi:MAG: hypothetical protein IPF48_08275 [Sphingomonadales bacterium]|nr:hypothetical protein [Sphingomonadales bacterium]
MSKQFVRYGLTSVHHSGGSFAALRAIRAQGRLVHRANCKSDPAMVDSLIAPASAPGSATNGCASAPLPNIWPTDPSPSAQWR